MANNKTKTLEGKLQSASIGALSPEDAAKARVETLQKKVDELTYDLRILQNKLSNRNPFDAKRLEKENAELRARLHQLQKALHGLIHENTSSAQPEDFALQFEVLRRATTQYFKKANIDPAIWKNIAY